MLKTLKMSSFLAPLHGTARDRGGTISYLLACFITAGVLFSATQASAAIAFRAAASAGTTTTTLTINMPTGTVQDDVMVAAFGFRTNQPGLSSDIGITPPAGWSLVRRLDNPDTGDGTDNGLVVYLKVAGASEPASYQWSFTCSASCATYGFQAAAGGILTFSGVDTATPIDGGGTVENGVNTISGAQTTPSVTTTVANTMLVASHTFASAYTWLPTPGGPLGAMNEAVDVLAGSQSTEINWLLQPAAGATGQYRASPSTDDDAGNAHILALRPAPAVTPNHLTTGCAAALTSFTTASISPGANRLVLLWVSDRDAGAPAPTSVSGNSLTWVQVNTVAFSTNGRLTLYRAMGAAPTAGSVTISFTANINRACWSIVEYDGVDTSGTDGSGAVVQSATATAASTSLTVTLAAFASANNVATGGFSTIANSTYTAGGGFSIYGSAVQATNLSIATEGLPANDTTVDISVASTTIAGIAVEVRKKTCTDPSPADYVAANSQAGQAIVYWASGNSVLILRKSGTSVSDAPDNGTSYAAGNTIGSSRVIFDGATADTGVTCTGTSCTNTGLSASTIYYYKVFARTGSGVSACYSSGTEVNARQEAGAYPPWSYMMSNGSTMRAGIAGEGSLNSSGNFGRILSLDTTNGTQMWTPVATNAAVQSWLTWLPSSWYDPNWTSRKRITIDHTKVGSGGVTDFPLLVSVTDTGLRDYAQASGNDILFTASNGMTKLSHEIEKYVSSTGELIAWVKVPSISSATDTVIYMYYGNATAANQQNAANVWDTNYKGVWHLKETSGAQYDSTQFGNNGTASVTTQGSATGKINGADGFSGTLDRVQVGTSDWSASQGTLELWGYPTATTYSRYFFGHTTQPAFNNRIQLYTDDISGNLDLGLGDSHTRAIDIQTLTSATWYHIVLTWNGSNYIVYVDGALRANGSYTGLATLETFADVGNDGDTASRNEGFNGTIDEVRVSNTVRSAGWILTDYNNQKWPNKAQDGANGFLTVGAEEPLDGGATVIGGDQTARVYSVDASTGVSNWTVDLTGSGADTVQAAVAAQLWKWSDAAFQAAYGDDVLFVPTRNVSTTNNKLFALRASDGSVLWSFNGTIGSYNVDYIVGMPWVDYGRNRVYVVSRSNGGAQASFWVINSLTGALVTSFNLGDLEDSPTMSYDGATLYIGNLAGTLYAYNLNTLTQKWSLAVGGAVKGFVWEDWNTAGRLYFATDANQVRCVQDNGGSGSIQWTTAVTAPSTPLPMDTLLYVGSSDGKVHQLRLSDGNDDPAKRYTVGSGAYQVGDVSTETWTEIFVPTTEGKLYKLPLSGLP